MHITKVIINDFFSFKNNFTVEINKDKNIIVGTNGTGKSNFMYLIYLTLKGDTQELQKYKSSDNSRIEITLELNENETMLFESYVVINFLLECRILEGNFIEVLCDKLDKLYQFMNEQQYLSKIVLTYSDNNIGINTYDQNVDNIHKSNYFNEIFNEIKNISGATENLYGYIQVEKLRNTKLWDVWKTYKDNVIDVCDYSTHYSNGYLHNTGRSTITKLIKDYLSQHIIYLTNDNRSNNNYGELFEFVEKQQPKLTSIYLNMNDLIKIIKYKGIDNYNISYSLLQKIKEFDNSFRIKNIIFENMIQYSDLIDKINEKLNMIIGNNSKFKLEVYDYLPESKIASFSQVAIYPNHTNVRRLLTAEFPNINANDLKSLNITSEELRKLNKSKMKCTFDSDYVLSKNGQEYYKCSSGEKDLIEFLTSYLDTSSNILLIDEPCRKLASQNKERLRKYVLEEDNNKQIIMVTHDSEMVSIKTCENIIKFGLKDNITTVHTLSFLDETDKDKHKRLNTSKLKLLVKYKNVLFARRCLLVEGPTDYKFFNAFLKINPSNDYYVVDTGTKQDNLWKILNELNIEFKIIYDVDRLFMREQKNSPTTNIINTGEIQILKEILCDEAKYNDLEEHFISIINDKGDFNMLKFLELTNNKILVWNKKIDALEGVGKLIFGNGFIKKNWNKKSEADVLCSINKYYGNCKKTENMCTILVLLFKKNNVSIGDINKILNIVKEYCNMYTKDEAFTTLEQFLGRADDNINDNDSGSDDDYVIDDSIKEDINKEIKRNDKR